MNTIEYIDQGLNGAEPLKIILCGCIHDTGNMPAGVVSVVFATLDREAAKNRIYDLMNENPNKYYMVYSVPLDCDLTALAHYPSIAITKDDLQQR